MKSNAPSFPASSSFLGKELGEQPVRLIRASQALPHYHGNGDGANAAGVEKKLEVKLIHTGAEYCDLEITCGCGERTQVRCWNAAASAEKA